MLGVRRLAIHMELRGREGRFVGGFFRCSSDRRVYIRILIGILGRRSDRAWN